jgi:beta-glucosidase
MEDGMRHHNEAGVRFAVRLMVLAGLCAAGVTTAAAAEKRAPDATVEARVDKLLGQLTLEEKIDLLGGVDGFYIRDVERLGVPRLKMADGPLGVRNYGPATTMAGGVGLAATWDTRLAREVGTEIGRDARARGVHFMLGPAVNIHVAPMNGRNFEYLGEDPFLASRIVVGYIEGMQAQGVSATIKHFVANNSEYDRHNVDVIASERALREIYLPAFESAVKEAHVGAIMTSYNLVDGAHMSQNGRLNNDVVKKQWGFDGLIMSDWDSTYDGVAAANGGLDLEMPSGRFMNRETLLPAIKDGRVAVATIDDKVRRILRTACRFGWLDRQQLDRTVPALNQEGNAVALRGAREAMVLLKNDGNLLPLGGEKAASIAVIGPDAYPAVPVGGGSAAVRPFASVSFMEGLSDALGTAGKVYYHRGLPTLARLANATPFTTEATGGKPGLTVETFETADLSGPVASTRIEHHINQRPRFSFADFAEMDPAERAELFAAGRQGPRESSSRWTGYYTAESAGPFEVFAQTRGEGGGHRLYIDDRLVLDDWTVRKAIVDHAVVDLTAGPHKVVFERFRSGRRGFFGGTLRVGIAPQEGLVDPEALALAKQASVVVVTAGFDSEDESEGGDRTFALPVGQDELIREVAAANGNTIVVVTSGGAVDTRGWLDRVPALVESWYPGQAGGTALADLLLGKADPSGRLPISYDRSWAEDPSNGSYYPEADSRRVDYKNGVFVGYRGYEHEGKEPLFPFGYGLSYTTFAYDHLTVKSTADDATHPRYEVSFEVTNTGARAGADVAQVYVGDDHAKVARPPKELKGFQRVELQPGETKTVTVELGPRAFTYYDEDTGRWRADPGDFAVLVGRSSAQIELRGKATLAKAVTLAPSE